MGHSVRCTAHGYNSSTLLCLRLSTVHRTAVSAVCVSVGQRERGEKAREKQREAGLHIAMADTRKETRCANGGTAVCGGGALGDI